ncbi:hypothetical protein BH23CHL5_BH23CHL5_03720 [soil metagenome]
MIAVVLGPDRWMARSAVQKLVDQHDPDHSNTSRYSADSDSVANVINAVSTRSFFDSQRVIVATGYVPKQSSTSGRSKSTAKGRASKAGKTALSDPLDSMFAAALATGTTLILHEPELVVLPAALKRMLPADVVTVTGQPPRGSALIEAAVRGFETRGASIDRETVRYLLDLLFADSWQQQSANRAFDHPPDIETLTAEIEKLSLAATGSVVTSDLIDQLTFQPSADRVFAFLDATISGQSAAAIRELESFPNADEELTRHLAQLMQQIEFVAAARQEGKPADNVAAGKALGMPNPNRMTSVMRSLNAMSADAHSLLADAREADSRLKRGLDQSARDSLYRLIASAAKSP